MSTPLNPAPAKPSLASTRDAIARERHGCLYAQLDHNLQDAVAAEAELRLLPKTAAESALPARVAALETALRELLAAHDDYPAIKDLPEMPHWTRARAALAKEGA